MPLSRLSNVQGYRLAHPDQDWRGWPVVDTAGAPIGRVADFIVDTDEGHAVSLLLDTSREVSLTTVSVADRQLVVTAPPRVAGHPGPFEGGTYDVMARAEEIVISKRAKVVEELVVSREVIEQKERIRATVRRLDVDVEQYGAAGRPPDAAGGDRHGR